MAGKRQQYVSDDHDACSEKMFPTYTLSRTLNTETYLQHQKA